MKNTNETLVDIVAEMRQLADDIAADRAIVGQTVWRNFADRIEAAWKRDEQRAVEHATRHAEAVARDNCRDCIYNPRGKNYEGGNAAKLRETVKSIYDYAVAALDKMMTEGVQICNWPQWLIHKTKKVLAEPLRNCDRFKTQEEAELEFLMLDGLPRDNSDSKMRAWMCRFIDWLFAPATEKEGGVK